MSLTGFMEYAVLVNRTQRPVEVMYDGAAIIWKAGEKRTLPVPIAQHIMALGKAMAFDTTGCYVRLLGLEEAPDALLQYIDPECLDCSPVELPSTQPAVRVDLVEGAIQSVPVRGHNASEMQERQPAAPFIAR